ncbi:MAG: hypothetical protein C0631_17855 [Sedimenticola sp.]|nr:MAG: hypothetical protein C0631_17855 [Sedimenticola sp.]
MDANTIAACKENPTACGITLADVTGDALFGETEPNDSRFSADPITADIPLTGQLYSAFDEDWYFIQTTTVNGIITVSMAETEGSWNVSLRDSSGNILSSSDTTPGASFSYETTVAQTGNYYIVVKPSTAGTYTDSLYKLAAHVESSGVDITQLPYNFFDVELENNDRFTTANSLVSGIEMQGQMMRSNDLDVYRIDSAGNEIVGLELCTDNDSCAGGNAWALVVLDGSQITGDSLVTNPVGVSVFDKSVDATGNSGSVSFSSSHPYFLLEAGVYNSSMIGKMDPVFGQSPSLNVGLSDPGTYYVLVMPILKRDSNGSVLLVEEVDQASDRVYIVVEPYNDDQYSLRVTRTSLTPSTALTFSDQLEKVRSKFSPSTNLLHIPEVKYDGLVWEADLRLVPQNGVINFKLEDIKPVQEPIGME